MTSDDPQGSVFIHQILQRQMLLSHPQPGGGCLLFGFLVGAIAVLAYVLLK